MEAWLVHFRPLWQRSVFIFYRGGLFILWTMMSHGLFTLFGFVEAWLRKGRRCFTCIAKRFCFQKTRHALSWGFDCGRGLELRVGLRTVDMA